MRITAAIANASDSRSSSARAENTKASILDALARRRADEPATEIATALAEIAKIARLRIEDAVN